MNPDEEKWILNRVNPKVVPFLYKYRSIYSKGLERIFTNNEIFFPDPTKFNDPFDCKPHLILHPTKVARDIFYRRKFREHAPHLSKKEAKIALKEDSNIKKMKTVKGRNEFYQEYIKNFGIYSLTEEPDHLLMWAHYSDSHKGICLQFEATDENTLFGQAYRVTYQKDYPTVNLMNLRNTKQFLNFFYVKADCWEYEQERRLLKMPSEGGSKAYLFDPHLLKGVILGAKISNDDEARVKGWVNSHSTPIKVYKAEIDLKSYRLNIKGINC